MTPRMHKVRLEHEARLRRIDRRCKWAMWILIIATTLALFAPILVYLLRL